MAENETTVHSATSQKLKNYFLKNNYFLRVIIFLLDSIIFNPSACCLYFKIHPESNQFSPPPVLPAQAKRPSSLIWTITLPTSLPASLLTPFQPILRITSRTTLSNAVASTYIWLFKYKCKVIKIKWIKSVILTHTYHISNAQQPHVANGCRTGQSRHGVVSTLKKILLDSTDLEWNF